MAEKHTSSLHGKKYRTLAELIDALDQQQGHQQALYALQREDVRVIERIELKKKIIDTAAALLQAGLEKGDRVVLWAGNSPEWIIACLAVIRAGGRIVPLDVQLDRSALERIIEDCAPLFIFAEKKRSKRLEELSCDIPRTLWIDKKNEGDESLWNLKGEVILPELTKDDGAVLFYTSGTTGPPKGVPLTHGNLAFQINRILAEGLNRDDDRLLLPLPLHHVYPFTVGLLFPLAATMPIVLPLSLTGPQIVRAVNKGDVSVICGVPRLYRALYDAIRERFASRGDRALRLFSKCLRTTSSIQLKTGWKAGKVLLYPLHRKIGSRLRLVASGGSPLDPNLARSLEGLGWQVVIGYGLTETSPLLTLNPPGTGRFESVGRAIEGVELRIDPSSGGDEGNGEVLARGPNVFSGYYQLPEESKESLTEDGWFRTGDLGTIDDEGYLKLQGRVSSLIVTESGKNITPEEVEEAYERCPQVRETGILEDDGRLVALVVPEEGADEDDPKKMAEALSRTAEDLPSYWQLADIVLTPRSLPRTRLGKIRRHLLEERYQEAKSGKEEDPLKEPLPLSEMSGEDRDLLENSAARTTWDWLAGRYGDRGLTPDSRLQSDLGIDSLEWMTVTVEVGVRAGVELDEKTIAEIRTVRDLLQKVASEAEEKGEVFSGEPLESPMEVLNDQQKRWLSPPGWLMSHARGPLLSLNSFIIRHYFDLEISGLENIPEGPCVFAPNHQSSLDPLVLAAILPQDVLKKTWWGGWTGIAFGNPLMRAVSRVGKAVPVDPDHAAISSLAFGAAVLRREHNLTWFPEGQRSPDGELRPFKPGIGLLLDRYPTP
ncbi:MAG TPA: AMP-binding protein, partial [Desulfuromonadales bacterium]|nr:AMP-binding protein [Desulfuromonadales bacterium]